jgi:hypothetical protein
VIIAKSKVSGKQNQLLRPILKSKGATDAAKLNLTYTATAAIDGQVSKLIFSQDN